MVQSLLFMNIQQAKSIKIIDLLETLGFTPIKTTHGGKQIWYLSPMRTEKDPSFTVNVPDNCWKDFGGGGGNILDFVMQYENTDLRGALSFLDGLSIRTACRSIQKIYQPKNNSIIIRKVKTLENYPLIQQLQEKGILPSIARKYLKEVYYLNGEKKYFGYAIKNDKGGYEIHNKLFKSGTLKSPTTLKGSDSSRVTLFEGMTDFLSALQYYNIKMFQTDVIIMHSLAFQKGIIENFKKSKMYKAGYFYLDHDQPGREAFNSFSKELSSIMSVKDMSSFYSGFKDVNDFWLSQKGKL